MGTPSDHSEEFARLYSGTGKLNGCECVFEVGQMKDGAIAISSSTGLTPASDAAQVEVELVGASHDGAAIHARGRATYEMSPATSNQNYRAKGPFEFTVGHADWSEAHDVRFAMTNLLFGRFGDGFTRDGTTFDEFSAQVGGFEISFHKLPRYGELATAVETGKATEITSELVIKVGSHGRGALLQLSHALCDLFTIAKGRIINWVYFEVFNDKSTRLFTFHQNRYTNPRAGSLLVDFDNCAAAAKFLEQSYPGYRAYNARHPGTMHGIGRLLLDISSPEFEQTRALVVMALVDALSKNECDEGIFRQRFERLRDAYDIRLDDSAIDSYVKSRDSLSHDLTFSRQDSKGEYALMLSVLRRLVLGVLGYCGEKAEV